MTATSAEINNFRHGAIADPIGIAIVGVVISIIEEVRP